MGLEIVGVKETLVKLRRSEEVTNKRLLRHMRNSAHDIAELARAYAPVDEGNLERAIQVGEGAERFLGRVRSVEFIGVNTRLLGEGYTKHKFRYDIAMHEGEYNLGPRSRAKANASGLQVGPKYLSRAWRDLEPEIKAKAERIVADTLRD